MVITIEPEPRYYLPRIFVLPSDTSAFYTSDQKHTRILVLLILGHRESIYDNAICITRETTIILDNHSDFVKESPKYYVHCSSKACLKGSMSHALTHNATSVYRY